jgi:ribonuclease VapC
VSEWVLDASALLAFIWQEPGRQQVAEAIAEGAAVSTVNLSETVAKLTEANIAEGVIRTELGLLELEAPDFDAELAYRAGLLRSLTRRVGLSLGDRACIALAQHLGLPVLTSDRAWQALQIGVPVRVIR